jgi:Na+-driven multidrug efflux pump
VHLFGGDAATAGHAVRALRTIALGFPFYAFGMVVNMAFNGAGDTWTPMWVNLLSFWAWELPAAWLLSRTAGLGASGINLAVTGAFCLVALVGSLLFRGGRWKTVKV